MTVLALYLVVINLIGLIIMYMDKRRAGSGQWRIPEAALFLAAILGGSLGTTVGMWLFRHKTRHWYFVVGMPAILVFQAVILTLVLLNYLAP